MSRFISICASVSVLFACGGLETGFIDNGEGSTGTDGGSGTTLTCGTDGTCSCYSLPSGTNLTTPTVSFKNDVMPVFHNYCDSCHGNTLKSGGLYLGDYGSETDAQTVQAGLVGQPCTDLEKMPFVTAGDWTQSFLMHKLDGDQCGFANDCSITNCGTLMPQGNPTTLPVEVRDTIRRWIQQGALDN